MNGFLDHRPQQPQWQRQRVRLGHPGRPGAVHGMGRSAGAVLAGLALVLAATPAAAQSEAELRMRKVESEVRALQRRVFPDGAGRVVEPEITPAAPRPDTAGAPSTTAVTDILARLDALEGQLRQLTAGTEENANALRLLQDRVRLLEARPASTPVPAGGSASSLATPPNTPTASTPAGSAAPAQPSGQALSQTPGPATTGPSAERLARVRAIAKPRTGDAGSDEYSYGFRLWEAQLYPEAQQQLTMYIDKYPTHAQISYGRNLLGRAYLDDGKAREAAPWFLRNYQGDKAGARAGDSLLYLGEAMIVLDDTARACIALAEFADTYPALATGRLKAAYDANRQRAKCS